MSPRGRLASWPLLLLVALGGLTSAGALGAQSPAVALPEPAPLGPPLSGAALDRATEEVASLMRCPVCQGLSVADSPRPRPSTSPRSASSARLHWRSGDRLFERLRQFIRLRPRPRA
jgi:hypothetical protein